MDIRSFSILIALLIVFIPLKSLAEDPRLKTGYDIYHNIQIGEKAETPEQMFYAVYTDGYLAGYIDALVLMQTYYYNTLFPVNLMTEEEIKEVTKQFNFRRVNIPDSGIAGGQVVLIYKKFAEKHPERLNETARTCLLGALIEAYGWK